MIVNILIFLFIILLIIQIYTSVNIEGFNTIQSIKKDIDKNNSDIQTIQRDISTMKNDITNLKKDLTDGKNVLNKYLDTQTIVLNKILPDLYN